MTLLRFIKMKTFCVKCLAMKSSMLEEARRFKDARNKSLHFNLAEDVRCPYFWTLEEFPPFISIRLPSS